MINCTTLSDACACGQASVVSFLIDLEDTDLDALGADGISPLCAASIWGYHSIVQLLVDASCDPNVRNGDGTASTALHAAACQEHGKIVHLLLQAGADATLADADGRTPVDFASVSDALWPLFAARGLERTPKATLVEKCVIRKIVEPSAVDAAENVFEADTSAGSSASTVAFYTRPGSAYVRCDAREGHQRGGADTGDGPRTRQLESVPEQSIDPLAHLGSDEDGLGDGPASLQQQPTFSAWRE